MLTKKSWYAVSIKMFINIFMIFLYLSCNNEKIINERNEYPQKLSINIDEVDTVQISRFESFDSLNYYMSLFENELFNKKSSINYRNNLRVIFRYHDKKIIPIFKQILCDSLIPNLYKIRALNVIGCVDDSSNQKILYDFCLDTNDVIKECAINALGKCGTNNSIKFLRDLLKEENNGYVITTINAAIKRLKTKRIPLIQENLYDTSKFITTSFLFNPQLIGNANTTKENKATDTYIQGVVKEKLIYPHQQYKMNPNTISNRHNFKLRLENSNSFHVGEDSGFLMEGLPIHSIASGVVTNIVYEQSWGYLVAVQSTLKRSGTVTSFYGHLSRFVDVEIGQKIKVGEKIGDLGPQESLENGGYTAHLHWGIAKGGYEAAQLSGYAPYTDRWYNPITVIGKENNEKNKFYRDVLFEK